MERRWSAFTLLAQEDFRKCRVSRPETFFLPGGEAAGFACGRAGGLSCGGRGIPLGHLCRKRQDYKFGFFYFQPLTSPNGKLIFVVGGSGVTFTVPSDINYILSNRRSAAKMSSKDQFQDDEIWPKIMNLIMIT